MISCTAPTHPTHPSHRLWEGRPRPAVASTARRSSPSIRSDRRPGWPPKSNEPAAAVPGPRPNAARDCRRSPFAIRSRSNCTIMQPIKLILMYIIVAYVLRGEEVLVPRKIYQGEGGMIFLVL